MKILLRNKASGLYFEAPGVWTDRLEWALDFRFVDRALNYAESWALADVEIAFFWDDPLTVELMPLDRAALQCAA